MPAPAEVAAGALIIPNDVIFEILSRTPMKSVCRFRCVSKSWRALVSDTVFVAAHESRTEPHLLLVANSANQEQGSQGRDLRLLDMHGNLVKVIKEVGFYSALCPSFDDAICVTFDYGGNTNLVDLPTGKHHPLSVKRSPPRSTVSCISSPYWRLVFVYSASTLRVRTG
jgi:hypothetical protein